MEKVVYLFEIFKIIFYYKFLKLRKVKFGSIKVWKNLKVFKPYEIFEMVQTAPPVTVAPSPRVSDPSPLLGVAHMHPSATGRCRPPAAAPGPLLRPSPSSTRMPTPEPPSF
jgi:hypothetical protein